MFFGRITVTPNIGKYTAASLDGHLLGGQFAAPGAALWRGVGHELVGAHEGGSPLTGMAKFVFPLPERRVDGAYSNLDGKTTKA